MRVFLTGSLGQLGTELLQAFSGHEVTGVDLPEVDITERECVVRAIVSSAPDVVVHAAALTDVDLCEREPDRAFAVNAMGTRHVAEGARIVGARMCYLSTDYIFSGDGARPYNEWDEPYPLSIYGRSKLGGERECPPGATIVRTSWLFGRNGSNMVKTILRLAATHERLSFVDDQQGCPTYAGDLSLAIRDLVVGQVPGVFHVTSQGPTTWFGFARDVLKAAGDDPERVRPITTQDLVPPRAAPRPAYSVLDNAALRLSGRPLLPDHRKALIMLVPELLASTATHS